MVQQRCRFGHADLLAKSLVGMSVGRQLFLGPYLPDAAMHCKLVLVSGSEDAKFVKIAEHLASRVRQLRQTSDSPPTTQQQLQWDSAADSQPPMSPRYIEPITNVVVQQCGHAVHVERPEAILRILSLA